MYKKFKQNMKILYLNIQLIKVNQKQKIIFQHLIKKRYKKHKILKGIK